MSAGRGAALLGTIACCACAPARAPLPAPMPQPPDAPAVTRIDRPSASDRLLPADPAAVGMAAELPAILDEILTDALMERATPGAAVAVGRHGRLVVLRGYGRTRDEPGGVPVSGSVLYDLASLTKVVATTTAAMILEEAGLLSLERTVASYLSELRDPAKAGITVEMLLTHSGGLEAFAPLYRTMRGREAFVRAIDERPLAYVPGTRAIYSDWDMVLLQAVIERITGQPLDVYVEQRIFRPLGMGDTGFTPDPARREKIAPTEVDAARGGLIHGEVHDPNGWALGGVGGHAGVFSSARDLAVFAQMLLNGGVYGGVRILKPETIARWTAPRRPGSSRALGWDTPSGQSISGRHFSPRSFGHTGFTGTSLWLDPERSLFVVLLTNRVYYTSDNQRHVALRRAVHDAVQASIVDAPLVDWEAAR